MPLMAPTKHLSLEQSLSWAMGQGVNSSLDLRFCHSLATLLQMGPFFLFSLWALAS